MKTTRLLMVGGAVILSLSFVLLARGFRTGPVAEKKSEPKIDGRELFTREWLPGDSRSHGGDGLGPVFNARSCVACHHQGGVGGAGPRHMNVTVVGVLLHPPNRKALPSGKVKPQQPNRSILAGIHPALRTENTFPLHRFGSDKQFASWKNTTRFGGFAGFAGGYGAQGGGNFGGQFGGSFSGFEGGSFGGNFSGSFGGGGARPNLDELGQSSFGFSVSKNVIGSTIQLVTSQRNAPPLFGLGLIDHIPTRVMEDAAAFQAFVRAEMPWSTPPVTQARAIEKNASAHKRLPIRGELSPGEFRLPVSGRVARLRDGRAGRFGWKAQTATLREFTLQACANELGLEVPGFPQAAAPWKPYYKSPGLDMTGEEGDALVHFVVSLPRPRRKPPETEQHAAEIAAGQKLFARIGCAICHQPNLGDVEGIYSDLLLHDMGPGLADSGQYGGSAVPGEDSSDGVDPLPILGSETDGEQKKTPKFGAGPREWRTPPLWGLRDSAPYLHDGRADTISAALALHGGEGDDAAREFLQLSLRERQQVELFLQSLAAPGK